MSKLDYGDLPLYIRMLFLLIGLSGASSISQGFVLLMHPVQMGPNNATAMGVAVAATIGSMRMLKNRNTMGYLKAILFLSSYPVYSAYIALVVVKYLQVNEYLYYWWPLVNGILFMTCLVIILNKPTYDFYARNS